MANGSPNRKQSLSEEAQDQLKRAWLDGAISDDVMDELDPDGLSDDEDDD